MKPHHESSFFNPTSLLTIARMFLLSMALCITGCASLQPQDFSQSSTRFELDNYFDGHHQSWGVFENAKGQPTRSFTCDSVGKRERSGDLVLTQHFHYSDGKTPNRNWHIRRVDSNHWQATANDMVGTAKGEGYGNAFYWEYNITLDSKNPLATVHVRQWMYLVEGTQNLMTRLVITKLGIVVAEASEVIHPASPTGKTAAPP